MGTESSPFPPHHHLHLQQQQHHHQQQQQQQHHQQQNNQSNESNIQFPIDGTPNMPFGPNAQQQQQQQQQPNAKFMEGKEASSYKII